MPPLRLEQSQGLQHLYTHTKPGHSETMGLGKPHNFFLRVGTEDNVSFIGPGAGYSMGWIQHGMGTAWDGYSMGWVQHGMGTAWDGYSGNFQKSDPFPFFLDLLNTEM